MHKQPVAQNCEAPLPWDELSDMAKTCINGGMTADTMVRLAYIMLDTAAELRRSGLGGEIARA